VIVIITSFMFGNPVKPAKAAAQVNIVSHTGYVDGMGYYQVFGEVENTGNAAARNMFVGLTLYDSASRTLETSGSQIMLDVLLPGRKAPFHYTAGTEGSLVNSYVVDMDFYDAAETIPSVLETVSDSHNITDQTILKTMNVTGQVKNSGSQTATAVKVLATFYNGPDGTGTVVGVSAATSSPYSLNAGQTGTFNILIDITGRESQFVSYVLVPESPEYAAIPELPIVIELLFLICAATASLLITRKKVQADNLTRQ
jgi:hypothetical protein